MKQLEGNYNGYGDYRLYYRGWLPDDEPQALLIIVHGLAEHGGRYQETAAYFAERGYGVFCHDHQGHGLSQGDKGYIERFSTYSHDLNAFIDLVAAKYPNLPLFLLGHSLGATIAIASCSEYKRKIGGLVLSATTCQLGASIGKIQIFLAKTLSSIVPKLKIDRLDSSTISKDEEVVAAYRNDPLVYTGKLSARLGAEIIKAMDNLATISASLEMPVLILHGAQDRLADPKGSRTLHNNCGMADKTLKIYQGLYHEIMNEPERLDVLKDIEKWLAERKSR
jgi:acylglycerol lipase